MSDGKMFRWYSDEDIEAMKQKAIEAAVRAILAMDSVIYDEGTIRAAAMVVRESIRVKQ